MNNQHKWLHLGKAIGFLIFVAIFALILNFAFFTTFLLENIIFIVTISSLIFLLGDILKRWLE